MKNLILSEKQKKRLSEKRLVFTASTGRCGTKCLAQAFQSTLDPDEVCSEWGCDPNFAWVVRASRHKQGVAKRWWLKEKIPDILARAQLTYIETSHYLVQGALGAALALGIPFDLIVLSRPLRDVAVSFWRRQSIPLTKRDKLWPSDDGNFIPVRYEGFSDYQLVYWWVLEMRHRMELYAKQVAARGGVVASTSLAEVTTWEGFEELCARLDLSPGDDPVVEDDEPLGDDVAVEDEQLSGDDAVAEDGEPEPSRRQFPCRVINPSADEMYLMEPPSDLEGQEDEVWERVLAHPRSRYTRRT